MTYRDRNDIDDNEIRVISGISDTAGRRKGGRLWIFVVMLAVLGLAAVGAYLAFSGRTADKPASTDCITEEYLTATPPAPAAVAARPAPAAATASITDTIVNGHRMRIAVARNAVPDLCIGNAVLSDTSVIMAFQAADVRKDNGRIVGSCVVDGELVSRGQSKAGFCAIVDGNLPIGMAGSSGLLARELESGGAFFRQYPLVAEGQPIDNKPRGASLRKALARFGDVHAVVISRDRLTFGEFARDLADLGASDAIYLVGSKSYGFVRTPDGTRTEFGRPFTDVYPNINFIVWR